MFGDEKSQDNMLRETCVDGNELLEVDTIEDTSAADSRFGYNVGPRTDEKWFTIFWLSNFEALCDALAAYSFRDEENDGVKQGGIVCSKN